MNKLNIDFFELDNFIKKQVYEERFSGAILIAQNRKPLFYPITILKILKWLKIE